jgi:hypothetical protein
MERKYCKYPLCGKELINVLESRDYCDDNNNKCKNKFNYMNRKLKLEFADKIIFNSIIFEEYKRKLSVLMKDRRIKIIPEDDLMLMGIDTSCDFFQLHDLNESMVSLRFQNYKFFHFLDESKIAIFKSKAA